MLLFQILQLLDAQVIPQQCKIHLAVWNGREDPLAEKSGGAQDFERRRVNYD